MKKFIQQDMYVIFFNVSFNFVSNLFQKLRCFASCFLWSVASAKSFRFRARTMFFYTVRFGFFCNFLQFYLGQSRSSLEQPRPLPLP
jgi:hypothetical protein